MGEPIAVIAKIAFRTAFFISVILSLLVLIGVVVNYMVVGFNMGIVSDILAMIQIWLPFNLNILMGWITIAITAYVAFRSSVLVYNMVNSYIGR